MKALIVITTVILTVVLTVTAIFTIDSITVRKAEMASIVSVDYTKIAEQFFEGSIPHAVLRQKLVEQFESSAHSKATSVEVTVKKADSVRGVLHILLETTYMQPNGRPRLISTERVYIRETQNIETEAEGEESGGEETNEEENAEYSFIRTIRLEFYKNQYGMFVPEEDGGLKENSIWRTPDYSIILDEIFGLA